MNTERGSAIVYVFIGIALFGVLMFVFSKGGNQNTRTLSDQQAQIIASDFLGYGQTIQSSIQGLLAKGCSENQISFQSPNWANATWYENPNSPTDKSCHIFELNGGKVKWREFSQLKYNASFGYPLFATGDMGAALPVAKFGSNTRHDLFLMITQRNDLLNYSAALKVCKHINKLNNVDENIANFESLPSFYHGAFNYKYIGTFNDNNGAISTGQDLSGKAAWCSTYVSGYIYLVVPIYLR